MIFIPSPLKDCYEIQLEPRGDSRGWFARFYCKSEFEAIKHQNEWVQMNHSFTKVKGTIRGMHYQVQPFSEIKLVRCIAGTVFDVVVDLRKDSLSFLKWFGFELSAGKKNMVYIPKGFAHGFQTLTDDCELTYLHTEYYMPKAEAGIRFDDPAVGIQWPIPVSDLSDRDKNHFYLDQHFKGV
jgi:dTDP-4-dehydrorhamnose 3,5-epimerase